VIEWEAARTLAFELGRAAARSSERVGLVDAAGRTLASELHSLVDLPGYASSAMDGWAVAGDPPWVVGDPILAGDSPTAIVLEAGTARAIATGGPVPPGARGVLRSEHGTLTADHLERNNRAQENEPRAGEHVRQIGEEAHADDLLLVAGTILTPPRVALAAVSGHDALAVATPPRVDVALLGAEIIGSGIPAPGQVRDAYAPQMAALLQAMGAQLGAMQRIDDDRDSTVNAISASEAPLLLTTGGTANGMADHVRAALSTLDATRIIDGVDMRPGHPVILAQRQDGRLILCLPGNPLAAMVCMASIAAPLIEGMLGRPLGGLGSTRFAVNVNNPGSHTRLLLFGYGAEGAEPTEHQRSAMLRGLTEAVGIAVVPPGGVTADEWVRILPLPW
jgi:molybdopterin molybdotransferase